MNIYLQITENFLQLLLKLNFPQFHVEAALTESTVLVSVYQEREILDESFNGNRNLPLFLPSMAVNILMKHLIKKDCCPPKP